MTSKSKYRILDCIEPSPATRAVWQRSINVLAEATNVPAALIMRVHSHEVEVYLKSQNPGNVYEEGERAKLDTGLYCETVMSTRRELLVANALIDPEWDHNPDIARDMISYCGLPVQWPTGELFGTICILDIKENPYSKLYRDLLEQFREIIQAGLEALYENHQLSKAQEELQRANEELDQKVKERTAELAQSVASLHQSESRYRRLVENAPEIVYSLSSKAGGVYYSPRVDDILGYSAEYLCEHPLLWHDSIHPEDLPLVEDALAAVKDGKNFDLEYRIRDAFGNWRWLHDRNMVIQGAESEMVIDGLATDITDRKQVAEKLIRAKDEAQAASNAKSEFLSSMSHELRTPLNAVLGFAQILQSDSTNPLTTKQINYIEYILEGGNHLLELVNQVLDLARVEADQLELSFEDVDVGQIVADCVALTIPLGKPRAITVTNELASGQMPHLRADKLRLKQVLINLLSNAVKYNNEGGTVTITGREVDKGFLRIFVTDTGIGIAENDRTRIFQMFDRLDIPHTLATEGAGIGLSVTKLLVEKMAGQIGFESEKGIGSTFWIELPLVSNDQVVFWDDTLRIGIDAIDKDHQAIASLLNKVSHKSIDEVDLGQVINELVEYIGYHFAREEAIMEVCGYPDIKTHREKHQILAAQVQDLAETLHKRDDPEISQRLRALLRDWWTDHIMKVDTELADYAHGKAQDIWKALESID